MHQGLVELQYVAPHSNGLFRGAISESGRTVCICGPLWPCRQHCSLKAALVLEVWQQLWQLPQQLLEAWAA